MEISEPPASDLHCCCQLNLLGFKSAAFLLNSEYKHGHILFVCGKYSAFKTRLAGDSVIFSCQMGSCWTVLEASMGVHGSHKAKGRPASILKGVTSSVHMCDCSSSPQDGAVRSHRSIIKAAFQFSLYFLFFREWALVSLTPRFFQFSY